MTTPTTIGFIGLGLIGGSLAKALRKKHPEYRLMACDPNRDTLACALRDNVIDLICESKDPRFAECSYLFLCAPVEYNVEYLHFLKEILPPAAVVSDVGSVKEPIHQAAEEIGLSSQFIGGHPMAGSERSGFENSNDHLLENAYYIITASEEVASDRLEGYRSLIASTGAIPLTLTPKKHDYLTAGISHLPHVIASSLVNLVACLDDEEQHMKQLAAGGFRDITRIASSSPVMWEQICTENAENLTSVLDAYIDLLTSTRQTITKRKGPEIYRMFQESRDYRDSIDTASYGPIKKVPMIYCDIEDEAGAIATIATILAMAGISIKNIGIIHNREFEQGVLKIEFYEESAQTQAAFLLTKRNYTIYER